LAHNFVIWHTASSFGTQLASNHHNRPDLSLFDKVPDRIRASRRRHHALCWAFTPNPVRFECVAVHSILLAPMSIIAFDGIQPERFPDQDVVIGAVFASSESGLGVPEARRGAELAVAALARGGDTIQQLRELGPFDDHGDVLDPVVRFEQHV
jgi:hypothetical protein